MQSPKTKDEFLGSAYWEDKAEAWHEPMAGVKRRILSHSPVGMMVLYRIAPNIHFPLHSHPHAQFGFFVEGGGDFRVGESVWKMKKGDSYYIPPGTTHELTTADGADTLIVDFFTPERGDFHEEVIPPDM